MSVFSSSRFPCPEGGSYPSTVIPTGAKHRVQSPLERWPRIISTDRPEMESRPYEFLLQEGVWLRCPAPKEAAWLVQGAGRGRRGAGSKLTASSQLTFVGSDDTEIGLFSRRAIHERRQSMAPPSAALRPPPASAYLFSLGGEWGLALLQGVWKFSLPLIFTPTPGPTTQVWVPPQGTNSCPSSKTQAQYQELQTQSKTCQDRVLVNSASISRASTQTSISVGTCQEGGTGLFPLGPPHPQPLAWHPQGTLSLHGDPLWQLLNSGILPPRPLLIGLQTPPECSFGSWLSLGGPGSQRESRS